MYSAGQQTALMSSACPGVSEYSVSPEWHIKACKYKILTVRCQTCNRSISSTVTCAGNLHSDVLFIASAFFHTSVVILTTETAVLSSNSSSLSSNVAATSQLHHGLHPGTCTAPWIATLGRWLQTSSSNKLAVHQTRLKMVGDPVFSVAVDLHLEQPSSNCYQPVIHLCLQETLRNPSV